MNYKVLTFAVLICLVVACSKSPLNEGPDKVDIKSEVMAVNLWTEVEFTTDFVTAPDMTVAMANAIKQTADNLRANKYPITDEVQFAQFRFTAHNADKTQDWDLMNMRVPINILKSSDTSLDALGYLDFVDDLSEGASAEGLRSAINFCEDKREKAPKFCEKLDAIV